MKTCLACGLALEKADKNYCNKECWRAYEHQQKPIKTCPECGKSGYWKSKRCSRERYVRWLTGRSVSPRTTFKKGSVPWNKGLKGYRAGPLNNNWKGGISKYHDNIRHTPEYAEWRRQVFRKDNFTCQNCKQVGGALCADHIKPFSLFPEYRFDVPNGRTLCVECHKNTETYGWRMRWLTKEIFENKDMPKKAKKVKKVVKKSMPGGKKMEKRMGMMMKGY